jgi:hypothetical protein
VRPDHAEVGHGQVARLLAVHLVKVLSRLPEARLFLDSDQGCQIVCFQTKYPNLGKFWRALEWKMLVFYGHLEYFTVIWYILWPFGKVVVIWYIFPRVGKLCHEKSGNPTSDPLCLSSSAPIFADYYFLVHHLINQDDLHLLAHAMASEDSFYNMSSPPGVSFCPMGRTWQPLTIITHIYLGEWRGEQRTFIHRDQLHS